MKDLKKIEKIIEEDTFNYKKENDRYKFYTIDPADWFDGYVSEGLYTYDFFYDLDEEELINYYNKTYIGI